MKQDLATDNLMRQYLLGQLPEDLQKRVEEQVLTDAGFTEQLQAMEDELADDYASGRLRSQDKENFGRVFLGHPTRREKLAFAQALRTYMETAARTTVRSESPWRAALAFARNQSPHFQTALASLCMIVVLAASYTVFRMSRLQRQLDDALAQTESAAKENQSLADSLEQMRARIQQLERAPAGAQGAAQQMPPFVAVSLMPGALRDSGGMRRIAVPPGKGAVRFELVLEKAEYRDYEAFLQTPEGSQVWSQKNLHPSMSGSGPAVTILVSSDVLRPQDYMLKVSGVRADGISEPVSTYYFRVPRASP